MISMGEHYRGPELEGSSIQSLLSEASCLLTKTRADWHPGMSPGLNVVFYVPGSLGDFPHITKIAAGRFSRKQKLLLVEVPVPRDVAEAGGSVEFVIDALRQAVTIAAEVFARKGPEPFDPAKANEIIDRVSEALRQKES